MSAIDNLIEFLEDVVNNLESRGETVPNSLTTLLVYCNNYIKRNKYQVQFFDAYFQQCRNNLVKLSQGGYIYFESRKKREEYFAKFDGLGKKIREDPNERKSNKQSRFRRIVGFFKRRRKPKKLELEAPKREASGLELYKTWCEKLLREFEAKFDPSNPESSKRVYQIAKRIYRILEGPLFGFIYSGAFEREGSKLSGGNEARRQRIYLFLASQSQELIQGIDRSLSRIRQQISAETLLSVQTEIIPLGSRWDQGLRPNDHPALRTYIKQLSETINQIKELLAPLTDINVAEAIMLQEDLLEIRSIYQSLNIDRLLWQAFYETCTSGDKQVHNLTAILNYEHIRFETIGKICDRYERAFSVDHLSESDKGIAFILGISPDEPAAVFEEPTAEAISEGFLDPKGYFRELNILPSELSDKPEDEIKKFLKKRYYHLAKGCHPDLYPSDRIKEEKFKKISESYAVLSNVNKRNKYLRS